MDNTINEAIAYFEAKLRWQLDPADLADERRGGEPSPLVVDVRSHAAWHQGHIPRAINVPRADLATLTAPTDVAIVVYCWGPGCNGSTKAALELLRMGIQQRPGTHWRLRILGTGRPRDRQCVGTPSPTHRSVDSSCGAGCVEGIGLLSYCGC